MAQFYTLEEAARVLGMDVDDLKQQAQQREVRAFMDGGTWRFRVPDIEELARRRGLGSDPDLAPSAAAADAEMDSDSDFDLSSFSLGSSDIVTSPISEASLATGLPGEDDILLDDLSLPAGPGALNTSSTIIGAGGRSPSESDIRLVGASPAGLSDSDVRLASASGGLPGLPGSSAEVKSLGAAPLGSASGSGRAASPPPESEVYDADSSDFELTALDSGDDFESAPARKPSDSDVTGFSPAQSGINLGRPSDSGINLQSPSYSGFSASGVEMSPQDASSEMSATVLPVSKPIFDDTDFELDAASDSSGSVDDGRTVQLDAASDFDMDEADSDQVSEVFAMDEEDVDLNAATALGPAGSVLASSGAATVRTARAADSSLQEPGAVSATGWDISPEAPSSAPSRASTVAPVLASAEARQDWGGVWVGFLMVATVMVLLTGFVSLDLLHNMYGYRGETAVGTPLVKVLAGLVQGG